MVSFTERDAFGIRLAIGMTSDPVDNGDIIAIKCGIVRHTLFRVRDRRFGWLRRRQYSSHFSETTAEEFEEYIFPVQLIDFVQRTVSGSAPPNHERGFFCASRNRNLHICFVSGFWSSLSRSMIRSSPSDGASHSVSSIQKCQGARRYFSNSAKYSIQQQNASHQHPTKLPLR